MKTPIVTASLLIAFPTLLWADSPVPPPLLEFSSGLPGQQVRLSWPAEAGLRYRIEKSTNLGGGGGGGGAGGWTRVATVDATAAEAVWLDPEPTTARSFYRVVQPVAEVYSISPPLLSPAGGDLLVHGQCLPDGSMLVLVIEGTEVQVPLVNLGGGVWKATVGAALLGAAVPGASILSSAVRDPLGVTLVPLNQPIALTQNGLAKDSPPSLPPAAPLPDLASNPIPGVGIVVKRNPGSSNARFAPGANPDTSGWDTSSHSAALMAAYLSKKGYDYYQSSSSMASKRGYDYYKAKSDMASAMLKTNPLFVDGPRDHRMPNARSNPLFQGNQTSGSNPFHEPPGSIVTGPGATCPSPSGLPGEVSFQSCDIALPCPNGPALAWISTYRSMNPVSSGHGPGWDFSYNISIEPLPPTGGVTAPRLVIRDGGGRADIFHRQTDGSYRCDGMLREGRFTGDTFSLTFADTGTWTFKPLDGSPAAGKIAAITDRNGVGLECAYDPSGQLSSVSDDFGRSLAVEWGSSPSRILSVTAQSVSLSFSKITYHYDTDGRRDSASCPFVPGQAPPAGPVTYAYASGFGDPRLNDNLLSITDGAGRLLEGFTYTTTAAPADLDYDTCISHDRHRIGGGGHVTVLKLAESPPGSTPGGGYTIFEVDEVGRLTETDCDRLHRVVRVREYTGFCTPGTPATATTNRPAPATKLRASDPDFFETSCAYNIDHLCTRITHADGSQEVVSYQRDLDPACAVRERANPRVISRVALGGKSRTVSCTYLPGFGNSEPERPGNPIGGLTIKGGKNPGGGMIFSKSSPSGGISGGVIAAIAIAARQSGGLPPADGGEVQGHESFLAKSGINGINGGMPNRISMNVTVPKQTQGATFGDRVAAPGPDDDCDGTADFASSKEAPKFESRKQKAWLPCNFRVQMVSAHGQVSTWGYDDNGNCTSALSSLPNRGTLYQYTPDGRCTRVTVLNGTDSSFHHDFSYNPATGFMSSVVSDSGATGLNLTVSCDRDPQGRVTRVVDPLLNDWLFSYNSLDQCVQVQSPGVPNRISMTVSLDAGGRTAVCSCSHLRSDGSPDPANPEYSTFFVHDSRARLSRVAVEERPADASGLLVPDTLGIENFDVCDITRDPAGQIVSLSTPAACRMQAADEDCDFTYDERGLLHRCIAGGSGSPASVTTECDYDSVGAPVRHAITGAGVPGLETLHGYDSFHRLASITDAMGNVVSFSYANDGMVSCTLSGEILDEPGSAGNTELARVRFRKRPELLYQAWDDTLQDYITSPGSGGGGHGGALYLKAKEKANRTKCANNLRTACGTDPFFDVEVEDEVCIVERFTPRSPAEPVEEVTVIDRSPAGLVQSVTRNGDLIMTCTYDRAGRLATCSNGACTTALTRDAGGRVRVCGTTDHFRIPGTPDKTFTVTRDYDALGRCVTTTDGTGNVASCAYDSLGRPVSETEPGGLIVRTTYDGSSATGPFSSEVSADADNDGDFEILSRSLSRCGGSVYSEDSYGHRTSFALDALGRLASVTFPDTTHEDYEYDLTGALHRVRGRSGTATFTRDLNLQVTGISHADLAPGIADPGDTSFTYSGAGECVRCEQGSSLLEFSYDSLGNPLSESHNGRVITREFNHRGRTKITYPDGRRFAESRDALGQPLSISALDAGGLPMSPPVVTMEYAGERVWRSTQANGVVSTFNYRGDNQAAPPTDRSFDTCVEVALSDALGHELTHVVQQRDRNQCVISYSTTFSSSPQGSTGRFHVYTYNRLGQLTACLARRRELPGGPVILESNVSYTLDLEGRRLSATGGANPGTYTQDNGIPPGDQQMGQYTTWPEGGVEWDDEGNLRTINRGSITHHHAYDAEGQLLSVTDPATGTVLASFTYDAAGRRSSSTVSSGAGLPPVVTEFVYDGTECIQELTANPGTGQSDAAVTSVSSGGVKHCISTRNGTLYYPAGHAAEHWGDPHENLNGRYALMTTATGGVSERFDCDDAGKPVFLAADGVPTAAKSAVGPLRWMAPEAMWEPSVGLFLGGDSVYCPELGMTVCRGNGHVTVLKAAAKGGGHVTVLKAAAKGGGHVTVLKAAAGGGMGGGGKAQDHNSSRSNKTSS